MWLLRSTHTHTTRERERENMTTVVPKSISTTGATDNRTSAGADEGTAPFPSSMVTDQAPASGLLSEATPSSIMDQLPDHVLLYILTFTGADGVWAFAWTTRSYRQRILTSAPFLCNEMVRQRWPQLPQNERMARFTSQYYTSVMSNNNNNNNNGTDTDNTSKPPAALLNFPFFLRLGSPNIPSTIDESLFCPVVCQRSQIRRVPQDYRRPYFQTTFSSSNKSRICYERRAGPENHCVRSADFFPMPSSRRLSVYHTALQPFTVPYRYKKRNTGRTNNGADTNETCLDLSPRLLVYYEVTIHPREEEEEQEQQQQQPDAQNNNNNEQQQQQQQQPNGVAALPNNAMNAPEGGLHHNHPDEIRRQHRARHRRNHTHSFDCVAVGVSNERFTRYMHRHMPGWDDYSYGYHGDDGGLYHEHGQRMRRAFPRFGVGDTVGCGIDFWKRSIFFTLNGEFLGYGWTAQDKLLDRENGPWAPTIGIDTNCPVSVNFGLDRTTDYSDDRVFCFDLDQILRDHQEQLVRSAPLLVQDPLLTPAQFMERIRFQDSHQRRKYSRWDSTTGMPTHAFNGEALQPYQQKIAQDEYNAQQELYNRFVQSRDTGGIVLRNGRHVRAPGVSDDIGDDNNNNNDNGILTGLSQAEAAVLEAIRGSQSTDTDNYDDDDEEGSLSGISDDDDDVSDFSIVSIMDDDDADEEEQT